MRRLLTTVAVLLITATTASAQSYMGWRKMVCGPGTWPCSATAQLEPRGERAMLTYRPNRAGTLHAAYLGAVRVGYVEARPNGRWIYQSIFVRPEGGCYCGRVDSDEEARSCLLAATKQWVTEAGLRRVEDEVREERVRDLFGRSADRCGGHTPGKSNVRQPKKRAPSH